MDGCKYSERIKRITNFNAELWAEPLSVPMGKGRLWFITLGLWGRCAPLMSLTCMMFIKFASDAETEQAS